MILMPDPATAVIDPFYEETTVNLRCDVIEPMTMQGYERDPRSLAKRAEAYLKSSGIADSALFGPENEFFIFDSVRSSSDMNGCSYEVDSYEGAWNSGKDLRGRQQGPPAGRQGRLFPGSAGRRAAGHPHAPCAWRCEEMGLKFEVHHHEVATAGQGEINVAANTLTKKADEVQILKYALQNVAHGYGKTADLHAEAHRRRQRQRHARAPVAAEGRQGAVRRRQVRRPVRHRALLHRRHHQARARAERLHQCQHQQLQAPGAGLRSAGQARLLGAQPLRLDPHSLGLEPQGRAASRCASRTRPPIRTSPSPPC